MTENMKCFRLRCRTTCDNVNAYGTSPVEYRWFGSGIWMKTNWEELVFYASPSPYTYEELTAHLHEGEGYVIGMTLEERTGIDEDNALFCRIR